MSVQLVSVYIYFTGIKYYFLLKLEALIHFPLILYNFKNFNLFNFTLKSVIKICNILILHFFKFLVRIEELIDYKYCKISFFFNLTKIIMLK